MTRRSPTAVFTASSVLDGATTGWIDQLGAFLT